MNSLFRIVASLLVCLLVLSGSAAAFTPNPPSTPSANNSTTHQQTTSAPTTSTGSQWQLGQFNTSASGGAGVGIGANTSANGTNASAGGGFHIGVPSAPGPKEVITKMIVAIANSISHGVAWIIQRFNNDMFGLPAPGTANNPSSWIHPTNGWWPGVFKIYGLMSTIAFVLFVPALQFAVDSPTEAERGDKIKRIAKAFFIGTVGGIPIMAFLLHYVGKISIAISPHGTEFMSTPGSATKLGVGLLFGGLLLSFEATLVMLGVFVLWAQFFLVHLTFAFWPLSWALAVQEDDRMRSFGYMGISAFVLLILLKFGQAVVLRFLFDIPWGAGGAGGSFMALLGTAIGVGTALIALPKIMLTKLLPGSMMVMAGRAKHKASGTFDRADKRIYSKYQDYRDGPAPKGKGPSQRAAVATADHRARQAKRSATAAATGSAPSGKRPRTRKQPSRRQRSGVPSHPPGTKPPNKNSDSS